MVTRNPALGKVQVNHAVGTINESLMDRFYTSSGWKSVSGQVGRTGIDGFLMKMDDSGVVRDLLIVESKYNKVLVNLQRARSVTEQQQRERVQKIEGGKAKIELKAA